MTPVWAGVWSGVFVGFFDVFFCFLVFVGFTHHEQIVVLQLRVFWLLVWNSNSQLNPKGW